MRALFLLPLVVLLGCDAAATGSTLADCATDIGTDAHSFLQTYFLCVDASASGDGDALSSDGLPPHESPYWGEGHAMYVAFDDRGGTHFQNPNTIGTQNIAFTIPSDPTPQAGLTITDALVDTTMQTSDFEYRGGPVGLALNGVAMFAAMAAPGDDIYDEAFTFDLYEGHPAGEQYHYHWHSQGPLEVLEEKGLTASVTPGEGDVEVYGMMCDGTVVLGCTELDGAAPDTSDFDAQNGHLHDLDDGTTLHFVDLYHTHVCADLGLFELFPEIAYYEPTGC